MDLRRLDIKEWEAFISLAKLRHFGHAAEELCITQSAISQRMSKLESSLQLRLLIRSNQGVELTESGQSLLPEARALVTAKRRALEAAASIRENSVRPVRLLLSNAIIHTPLLALVNKALEDEHQSTCYVEVETADVIEVKLQSGECDLAITTLPMVHDGYEQMLLTRLTMAVALPESVALATVSIEELCQHPLLLVPRETQPQLFDKLVFEASRARQRLQVGHYIIPFPSILAMVALGQGWGIVPLAMAGAVPDGVKVVPLSLPEPPTVDVLMCRKGSNKWANQLAAALQQMDFTIN